MTSQTIHSVTKISMIKRVLRQYNVSHLFFGMLLVFKNSPNTLTLVTHTYLAVNYKFQIFLLCQQLQYLILFPRLTRMF